MRLTSFVGLGFVLAALAGCDGDEVTAVTCSPTASVRVVNAMTEGLAIDLKAVDQVECSPEGNGLGYRATTVYYPTEAGARRIRIFPTSTNIAVTSVAMLDTTITFAPNSRVTLLVVGSALSNTTRIVVIDDDFTAPPEGQIGIRVVNASSAPIDGAVVAAVADPLPTPRTFASVAPFTPSPYINRPAGAVAVRAALAGSATVSATAVGPTALAPEPGKLPGAGINTPLTKFSVYYFPAVTARAAADGRPAVTATAASLVWHIDRNPAD